MRVHLLGGPRDGDTVEVPARPDGAAILVASRATARPANLTDDERDPIKVLRYHPTDELRRTGIFEAPARVYVFEGHHE